MANATVRKEDERWHPRFGIYPLGTWGEIITDENSIVGRASIPTHVTVTDSSANGIENAGAQMLGVLSTSRSKDANEFAKFFFENVVLMNSAYDATAADPFEFKSAPPRVTRILKVTVKSLGRAAPPVFEE
jgi:hypothetical protein